MRLRHVSQTLGAILTVVGLSALPASAQQTPFYVFDGDAQRGFIVQNGNATVFNTFGLGYPVSVRNTVWLGDRDNREAREFDLAGNPTGNTSAGGPVITQILDGTTDGINNYGGVFSAGRVTIANLDWSNQSVLFNLPDSAAGITYDPTTNTLFVGLFNNQLQQYSLTGTLLNTFQTQFFMRSLAYEALTDTLWFAQGSQVRQLDKSGNLLNTVNVTGTNFGGFGNNFGGEMPIIRNGGGANAPEPGSAALALLGLSALGLWARRKR